MLAILTMVAAMGSLPKPGELKSFDDWAVGCDNGRVCTAVSLMEMESGENQLTLEIRRAPNANAAAELTIPNIEQRDPGASADVVIDGQDVIATAVLPANDAPLSLNIEPILRSAAGGAHRLHLRSRAGTDLGSASLKGLLPALAYMDQKQGRTKTAAPLVALGSAPAPTLSTAPRVSASEPVIVAKRPAKPDIMPLSAPDIQSLQAHTGCEAQDEAPLPVSAMRLDARTWLALVPCGAGSYNFVTSPVLIAVKGKSRRMKPAEFDFGPGFSQTDGAPLLANATWDAAKGELSSFAKGRALGDCGSAETYVWDGQRFRLAAQVAMAECRGVLDWIPTWRATVVRR